MLEYVVRREAFCYNREIYGPPKQEVQKGSPEGASLAESLLLALKTSIDTPAEQQPEYRVMLSALQRSAEKSDILKNVRTMVDKLQPQERAIITRILLR